MSKQTEDTLFEVHQEVEQKGLRKKFNEQLRKMSTQTKHNHKTSSEKWEYALNKIRK